MHSPDFIFNYIVAQEEKNKRLFLVFYDKVTFTSFSLYDLPLT
jgi:hypothetical protein